MRKTFSYLDLILPHDCRYYHLLDTAIDIEMVAPLNEDWVANIHKMVPESLMKLKPAVSAFMEVSTFFSMFLDICISE